MFITIYNCRFVDLPSENIQPLHIKTDPQLKLPVATSEEESH